MSVLSPEMSGQDSALGCFTGISAPPFSPAELGAASPDGVEVERRGHSVVFLLVDDVRDSVPWPVKM